MSAHITSRWDFRSYWSVASVIVVCTLIELVLFGADRGWIGNFDWRNTAYANGGFWSKILRGRQSNYPGQSVLMFITYGFLHGGLLHLVVNMLALRSLHTHVSQRTGQMVFLAIYVLSMIGGAAAFALLSSISVPVVGASGAIFGLIGVATAWGFKDRNRMGHSLWPIYRLMGILVLMNVVLWWILDGQLAWQAHLGGFLVGCMTAVFLDSPGLHFRSKT